MDLGLSSAEYVSIHESPELRSLLALAAEAAAKAYAPYSRFHVGAAVELASGAAFVGCNVENASYPIGTCAERNALAACVLGREDREKPVSLVVVALQDGADLSACSPCGACRQAIVELNPDCEVHFFFGESLKLVSRPAAELLPYLFVL